MSKETTPTRLHDIVDSELRHVLAKRGDQRSYDDLLILKSRISQIDFIRGVFANLHPLQIDELCKCMNIEIFEEGDDIFCQGDKGDKFYVVLSGNCEVLLKQRTGIYTYHEDGTRTEEFTYQVIFTCHVGQHFGERALDYDEPRAATIRAGAFSELLSVTQHAYRKILKVPDYNKKESDSGKVVEDTKGMVNRVLSYTRDKRKETDLHAVAEYLSSHIPFFQKFDLENRIELIRMCELVKIWGRTTLFEQGDIGQAFYIILTGSVHVMINEADSEGVLHSLLVNTLEAGASFGERALEANSGGKRAATIVTSDEMTELIIINREEYQSIVSVMLEGDMMMRVRLLRATELFAPLDLKDLHLIARLLSPKTFRLNTVLFNAGDLAKDIYIIYKGECNLDSTLHLENGSSQVVDLGRAGPAAVLGDYTFNATSYYDETYYRETAVATALCSTFVFSKIDLFNVLTYEVRNEIITRIKNFTPASSSLWDTTPQLISEGDWCIRQTWKNFRTDISQRVDKKHSDKTITRHFKDHVKGNNSIGLAETKKRKDTVPVIKVNRFALDSAMGRRLVLPDIDISSPRSLSGLEPAQDGERQSSIKFSVSSRNYNSRTGLSLTEHASLIEDGGGLEGEEEDNGGGSVFGDEDSAEIAWRGRKKKLELMGLGGTVNGSGTGGLEGEVKVKQSEIHGPAGGRHIHVQSQLGNNTSICFKPFALIQLHRNRHDDLGARRNIETSLRLCGSFDDGISAKEAAESQILNCYIKINKLTFSVQWHRFAGYENMPLDHCEHFVIYCRSVPVEYASFHTVDGCNLTEMPFPPSCKIVAQNYACVSVNDLKKPLNEYVVVDRSQMATKEFYDDAMRPLYAREIGVVGEVFAASHTKLECTRFSCLALKDRIQVPPQTKLVVAALYHWYVVTEDVMLSLVPSDLEAPPDAQVVSTTPTPEAFNLESGGILSVDSSDVQREFASILEAYGGGQATSASRRDVDLHSINSITKNDTTLIRRDLHSRGISSRVDRRLQSGGPPSRKRGTNISRGATDDKEKAREHGLILSEANYLTRRENIKSLIASRKEIIKKNDEYCDVERKLLHGEFQTDGNTPLPRQQPNSSSTIQDKMRLLGEAELVQSVSTKRLDVLQSLTNAPTLTAMKSDTALMKQKTMRNLRFNNNNSSTRSLHVSPGNKQHSGGAILTLQQKLDVLEELMMNKSAAGGTVSGASASAGGGGGAGGGGASGTVSPAHRQKRVSLHLSK